MRSNNNIFWVIGVVVTIMLLGFGCGSGGGGGGGVLPPSGGGSISGANTGEILEKASDYYLEKAASGMSIEQAIEETKKWLWEQDGVTSVILSDDLMTLFIERKNGLPGVLNITEWDDVFCCGDEEPLPIQTKATWNWGIAQCKALFIEVLDETDKDAEAPDAVFNTIDQDSDSTWGIVKAGGTTITPEFLEALNWSEFSFIYWLGHGSGKSLTIGEKYTEVREKEFEEKYGTDAVIWVRQTICHKNGEKTEKFFAIGEKFIENYMRVSEDCFVYNASCHGGVDDTLFKAFHRNGSGAYAYIGWGGKHSLTCVKKYDEDLLIAFIKGSDTKPKIKDHIKDNGEYLIDPKNGVTIWALPVGEGEEKEIPGNLCPVENKPPVAKINKPAYGSTFFKDQIITFEGEATDPEDGPITGSSLVWTSSIDGEIGTGEAFHRDNLSIGIHTITLTAIDSAGKTGSDSVQITVMAEQEVDTIFLRPGCILNGKSISTSDPQFVVSPGSSIAGLIKINVYNGHASLAIFPVAWTPNWEDDNSKAYVEIDGDAEPGNSNYDVPVNVTAPTLEGTYYMIFAASARYGSDNLMASKPGNEDPLPSDWNDGNDIADASSDECEFAIKNGYMIHLSDAQPGGQEIIGAACIRVIVSINHLPIVSIHNPADGSTFQQDESIAFQGEATDPEDGPITGSSLVWTSSIDGEIGTGEAFHRDNLSIGIHTITLTATDSEGASATHSIQIIILEKPYPHTVIDTIYVGDHPTGVGVRPNGSYIFVANGYDNTVSVIRASDRTVIDTVPVGNYPTGIAVTPNGAYAYVANASGNTVSVIGISAGGVVDTILVGSGPLCVAVTPDGEYVYVTNCYGGTVSVIRASDNKVVDTVPVGEYPIGVAVTPDGRYLYVANQNDDAVSVIRISDNKVIDSIPVGDTPHGVAVTPDGNYVYVANYYSGSVSVIRTSDRKVIDTVAVGNYPREVSATPNGNYLYVTKDWSDKVSVIRVSDNNAIDTISVGNKPHGVAVTPDGNYVYVANYDDESVSVIGFFQ